MTKKNTVKLEARDIQDRTGWSYQFCQRAVVALGYETVSDQIDSLPEGRDEIAKLGKRLNAQVQKVGAHVEEMINGEASQRKGY